MKSLRFSLLQIKSLTVPYSDSCQRLYFGARRVRGLSFKSLSRAGNPRVVFTRVYPIIVSLQTIQEEVYINCPVRAPCVLISSVSFVTHGERRFDMHENHYPPRTKSPINVIGLIAILINYKQVRNATREGSRAFQAKRICDKPVNYFRFTCDFVTENSFSGR